MSAYLQFFELERSPFDTKAQSGVVLGTQALRDAFAAIESALAEGSPRICVSGRSGLGKTSLARSLPKLLGESARVVVLLNPALSWRTLRTAIIKQFGLEGGLLSRKTLLEAAREGRRLVIVIDRAETFSRESLEHLDVLLQYRGDDDRQLVHCVMLANLETAAGSEPECALLWWLDRLTTLQLEFAPIPADGVASYIHKHLKRAGWKGDRLFSSEAALAVHRLTGGVPRAVSEMCERVLAVAAERSCERIDADLVEEIGAQPPRSEATDAAVPIVAPAARARETEASEGRSVGAGVLEAVEAPIHVDSFFSAEPGAQTAPAELAWAEVDAPAVPQRRWLRRLALAAALVGLALVASYFLLRPEPAPVLARMKGPVVPAASEAAGTARPWQARR